MLKKWIKVDVGENECDPTKIEFYQDSVLDDYGEISVSTESTIFHYVNMWASYYATTCVSWNSGKWQKLYEEYIKSKTL